MATKLDQSLDEIMTNTDADEVDERRADRLGAPAPVGGISKNTRPAKGAVKATPTGPAIHRDSKIVVSNLPRDVDETQIKEYFAKSVGSVKKVDISYGPNGQSRGIANIVFHKNDGASKAVAALNGLLIEVLVDASQAPAIVAPKGLGDRIAQPKVQPNLYSWQGWQEGPRRSPPAKKTAEELDSEMADYFDATAAPAEAAAPVAANGDAPMDDEIL
ncbi:hypothetical protein VE04_05651 [Pseudogymnoascus sp. 24MN13]|nr:hypothetical protein VE04_05651 [Pseudogymnoascus sp. 24MN13]